MNIFILRFRGWQQGRPRWCIDPELAANIENWDEQNPDANQEMFARFCLHDARNDLNSLATRHLSAFLEYIGYQRSQHIYANLTSQRNNHHRNLPPDDSLENIFQYAWLEAANPVHFFRNFQAQQPSLIRYATSTMNGRIQDQVFGDRYPTIRRTGYGLLRRLGAGENNRIEALKSQGYRNNQLSNLLLAWECFYQICTPNRQRKIQPTMAHWQAIASQYNNLRQADNPIVDWQIIKDWIDNYCIPAAINYLSPPIISIDANHQDTDEVEIDIPDTSPTPNVWLQQEEMNELVRRLIAEFAFSQFIDNLTYEDRKLLLIRYGFEFRQTDVAEEFNWRSNNRPDNSRVSKIEDRMFRELARAILKWMVTSQIQLEDPVVINSQWLRQMSIKSVCEILMQRYYYPAIKSIKEEVVMLGNQQLIDSHQKLKNYIVNQIQIYFNVTLQPDGYATNIIYSLWADYF